MTIFWLSQSPFLEFFPGGQRKTRVCNKGLEHITAAWIIHDLQEAWTLCLYLNVGYILSSYHGRQTRGDSCTVCRQLKILWAQICQQCLHSLEKPAGEGPWPLQAVITGISGSHLWQHLESKRFEVSVLAMTEDKGGRKKRQVKTSFIVVNQNSRFDSRVSGDVRTPSTLHIKWWSSERERANTSV